MLFSALACVNPTRRRLVLLAAAGTLGAAGIAVASAGARPTDTTPTPTTETTPASTTTAPLPDPAPAPKKTPPKPTPAPHPTTKPPVHTSPPVVQTVAPVQPSTPVVSPPATPAPSGPAVTPAQSVPVQHARVKRHRARTTHVKPAPTVRATKVVQPAVKRKRPIAASLVSGTVPVAAPGAQPAKTLLRLTLITLIALALCFLGLAAVPLRTLRRPGIVPVALRLRPVFGTVGLSLLGAVAVIYLLGGRLGA
jgi:hypothetical protein